MSVLVLEPKMEWPWKRGLHFYSSVHEEHCIHTAHFLLLQVVWIRKTLEQNGSQIELKHVDFQEQLDETSERLNGRVKRDMKEVFNVSDFNRYNMCQIQCTKTSMCRLPLCTSIMLTKIKR